MALWGNKDRKSVTGTIAVTNNSKAVVGTGTIFTTQLKTGNTLVIANVEYRIESITDNTHLTLHVKYAGSTATGLTISANEQPAYVSEDSLAQVYGVDSAPSGNYEAEQTANRARGLKTPGWVKYVTYQDSEGNTRHKVETLVAMGTIAGDAADDAVLSDD